MVMTKPSLSYVSSLIIHFIEKKMLEANEPAFSSYSETFDGKIGLIFGCDWVQTRPARSLGGLSNALRLRRLPAPSHFLDF